MLFGRQALSSLIYFKMATALNNLFESVRATGALLPHPPLPVYMLPRQLGSLLHHISFPYYPHFFGTPPKAGILHLTAFGAQISLRLSMYLVIGIHPDHSLVRYAVTRRTPRPPASMRGFTTAHLFS